MLGRTEESESTRSWLRGGTWTGCLQEVGREINCDQTFEDGLHAEMPDTSRMDTLSIELSEEAQNIRETSLLTVRARVRNEHTKRV